MISKEIVQQRVYVSTSKNQCELSYKMIHSLKDTHSFLCIPHIYFYKNLVEKR